MRPHHVVSHPCHLSQLARDALEGVALPRRIYKGCATTFALLCHIRPCMHPSQVIRGISTAAGTLLQGLCAQIAASADCPGIRHEQTDAAQPSGTAAHWADRGLDNS